MNLQYHTAQHHEERCQTVLSTKYSTRKSSKSVGVTGPQAGCGDAASPNSEETERDQWIKECFSFLQPHIVRCVTRTSKKSAGHHPDPQQGSQVSVEGEAAGALMPHPPTTTTPPHLPHTRRTRPPQGRRSCWTRSRRLRNGTRHSSPGHRTCPSR